MQIFLPCFSSFRFSFFLFTLCSPFARIFHQSAKPAYFYACRAQIMHAKSTKTLWAKLATPPATKCLPVAHKPLTALTFTFDCSVTVIVVFIASKCPERSLFPVDFPLVFHFGFPLAQHQHPLLLAFLFVFPTHSLCKLNKST